ncbi:MAG: aldehyde ferredoxin oxidoreductase N-terminal domain-containing protein, partial [bacterium]
MAGEIYGVTGKFLSVDLNSGAVKDRETMPYAELFLGGRGIATRIYWEEVAPDTGALEPE